MIARVAGWIRTIDASIAGIGIGIGLIACGLAAVGVAWRGIAATADIQAQLAFFVSGGFGGTALIVLGATVLFLQWMRRWSAQEREDFDRVLEAARSARSTPRPQR